MTGTNQSKVKVTLRDPEYHDIKLSYTITPADTPIGQDWVKALKEILEQNLYLEKNFCLLGFPDTKRDLPYLCAEMNEAIKVINKFKWPDEYLIEEHFTPDAVRYGEEYAIATHDGYSLIGLALKHGIMNRIHNHFEVLQGTVDNLSEWYKLADDNTKYAIRQLNIICHEIESLVTSQRMAVAEPEWVRPSQITTFLGDVKRYELTYQHKRLCNDNGYDREFGHVYMHWSQIGKTLFEVFRDENAPSIDRTTCEAINSLKNYSGEFDVEWGNDVTYSDKCPWHVKEQDEFKRWLMINDLSPSDTDLCLGYMPVGKIDLEESFAMSDPIRIRTLLGTFQDVYAIEVDGVKAVYDYCWTDRDYKEQQLAILKSGYTHTSK